MEFFENVPEKIFESYTLFLKSKADAEGNIKDENTLPATTISERFEKNEYGNFENGVYRLYHDVKLVCIILIHFYPQGTRNYQMVDKFYKFATELLLRECYRIGITLIDRDEDNEDSERTSFYKTVSHDFIKISTSYTVPIAETYHIATREIDLFSSTIAKSQLDQRQHELPNKNFEIAKVVPQTGHNLAPRLGFLAANTSNIPDPTLPPTEMMTKFLHPNWYALPTTVWLEYGDFQSWAPCFNEHGTVLDASRRGTIWLERCGYTELWKLSDKENVSAVQEPTPAKQEQKSDEQEKEKIGTNGGLKEAENKLEDIERNGDNTEELNDKDEVGSNGKEVTEPLHHTIESGSIKLENLYNWTPSNYIEDDEIEAFSKGNQQKLINQSLARLQTLKQKRICSNKVSKPTSEEVKLFRKVHRMLREVVIAKQVNILPKFQSKSFPVLQANYAGSIPVIRTIPTRKKKYKK